MKKKLIKFSLYFIGILIILILTLFVTTEYTSQPSFCSTCHYMEPYVEGWKTSTHADVTCTDCHYPPGLKSKLQGKFTAISMTVNYFTGVYKKSKPWAEITDNSCLRSGCHEERLLEGQVIFKEGIIFDHKPHLKNLRREKKLRCTSCHSQIVQGEHITVTESTCFLCHFKNQPEEVPIDDCTWCHSAPVSGGSMEIKYDHSYIVQQNIECQKCHGTMQVGDGTVPIERCSVCHAEIGKIEKYDEIVLIHKNHVTDHKVECQNCHQTILHKSISKTPNIMPECQSCHLKPHKAQLDLFSGMGGKYVPSHPNPMFDEGLNCQGCHIFHQYENGFPEMGETIVARVESCEGCHGKGYTRILEQWRTLMAEKLNLLDKSFVIVENEIKSSNISGDSKSRALANFDNANFNYQLVKEGNFVHNVAYSDELLISAEKFLRKALESINSSEVIPDMSVYSRLVPSECKNCHYGQEEIDVETFGIIFSHDIHIEKNRLQCSKCHSNIRRHGETVITKSECLQCHHSQTKVQCETCHTLQAQIYSGTVEFASEAMPDIMYEEGVECFSCHGGTERPVEKATKEKCENCHDSDYKELFLEWQEETVKSIQGISEKLLSLQDQILTDDDRLMIDRISSGLNKIEQDKSKGVHNIELISETLNEYSEFIESIEE